MRELELPLLQLPLLQLPLLILLLLNDINGDLLPLLLPACTTAALVGLLPLLALLPACTAAV